MSDHRTYSQLAGIGFVLCASSSSFVPPQQTKTVLAHTRLTVSRASTMGKRTAVSVAIAAAGSTAEDAALRRRVQYKIYQRQHRARQKNKTLRLEQDVAALADEVAQLEAQYFALSSQNRSVFRSRGTLGGVPAQTVAEFYRVFERGHNEMIRDQQAQFMRAIMATNVRGPDFTGVEPLIQQWQIYGDLFRRTYYTARQVVVETYDDEVIVIVDVGMTILPTRRGAMVLYPSVIGDEPAIQLLVTRPIQAYGSVRFVFDATATITWFGADMDFVTGMIAVLGSASRVSSCVEDSTMSLCTGRIILDGTAPNNPNHSEFPRTRWYDDRAYARRGVDYVSS